MTTDTTPRATMNRKPVFEIPAKSVINMDSGFKPKLLCDGPTFSTGSACAYSCSFCYVPSMMVKNPHWQAIKDKAPDGKFENVVIRRAGAIEAMRSQLLTRGKPRYDDPSDRRVIYASPLVDVAANMDLVKETVEACKLILTLTHWQIRLLSKSNLLPKIAQALEEWWGTVRDSIPGRSPRDRVIYGVSTGTLDDKLAAAFEQGTPKVSKRIESLHWLQDHGFRTFGMICPSLPQREYDTFAFEMANAIRSRRCEHVWAEVMNVRGDSINSTVEALSAAGYQWEAEQMAIVAKDKEAWESYSRQTFLAHARLHGYPKLRFLQYINNANREWWEPRTVNGAVLLGAAMNH
jgi:DNA repair photolyase